jgi:hypothetical protein
MLYDSDRVFRIFLGGIQSRFCFGSAPAVKQVFLDTIGSIGMKNRIITVQGAQVGITTRREQHYISLTDMVQRHIDVTGGNLSPARCYLLMGN